MRYRHQKYTWAKPFGSVRHNWSFVGPIGAINFHFTVTENYPVTAGLEIHRFEPADYQRKDPPSHLDCELTGGRCWHDGTSLYATNELYPVVESMLRAGDHDAIFRFLELEADNRFGHAEEDAP
jgi:hypothetical protein